MSANHASSSNSSRTAKQKSGEEAEVDALIQQLEVSSAATAPVGTIDAEDSAKGEPVAADQQRTAQKHGKRHLIGKAIPNPSKVTYVNPKKEAALTKNSRKSRNGTGRGMPKKGGGGGKGVWGKPGVEVIDYEEGLEDDAQDEPDDYDNAQMQKEEITKVEQLRTLLGPALQEFYNHGNSAEILQLLDNRSIKPSIIHMVAYVAVAISMDKKASERELTSALLADLYDHVLLEQHFEQAFDQLLEDLPDLVLDCPEASELAANYIARCIADDCLVPKYVESRTEDKGEKSEIARKTLTKAGLLINMKHGLVRLDNVWGVSGGIRPVKHLIKKMHAILKEYVASSGDVMEALRSLEELNVPHFNHEFVYEAILMVMEDGSERAFDLIFKLMKEAAQENILTIDQLKTGFQRIFDDLNDIVLDVPSAFSMTEKFSAHCQQTGVIPAELLKKFPVRGRKRFASENDGGRFKAEEANFREEVRNRVESNSVPLEAEEESGTK